MRPTVSVDGGGNIGRKLREIRERVAKQRGVLVGLPASSGSSEDGTPLAVIGAVHEFGGEIDHPGGTSYGYKTEKDAEEGRVRFLKKGQGFMELGVTGPHHISIPERSFLRVPLRMKKKEIAKIFEKQLPLVIQGKLSATAMLSQVGSYAVAVCQEHISAGIDPPNAASTIAKKGSSTPLVDNGTLRQSITYVLEGADGDS